MKNPDECCLLRQLVDRRKSKWGNDLGNFPYKATAKRAEFSLFGVERPGKRGPNDNFRLRQNRQFFQFITLYGNDDWGFLLAWRKLIAEKMPP